MLDTRRYRTEPEPTPPKSKSFFGLSSEPSDPASGTTVANHSMLGPAQLESLLHYLSTPEPPHVYWKIIASSVPFTKNWRFGTSDTWGGFLHERSQVLAAMHKAERDLGVRVVVLSGDRHEFAAIRFPPPSLNSPLLHLCHRTRTNSQIRPGTSQLLPRQPSTTAPKRPARMNSPSAH